MAYGQPAYRLDAFPLYEPEQRRRPDVRAVRGGKDTSSSSALVILARCAAVVLVLVAILSFARIALTNATVSTLLDSNTLSSEIAQARTDGTSLEMNQTVLTSSTALKSATKRLGMGAPYAVGVIELEPDVVATDEDGTLLLSESVERAVELRE